MEGVQLKRIEFPQSLSAGDKILLLNAWLTDLQKAGHIILATRIDNSSDNSVIIEYRAQLPDVHEGL